MVPSIKVGTTSTSDFVSQRLELAGLRPPRLAVATSPARLHLGLFGDLQRIVNLDPEPPDGALRGA
jgi:hypothetical protein